MMTMLMMMMIMMIMMTTMMMTMMMMMTMTMRMTMMIRKGQYDDVSSCATATVTMPESPSNGHIGPSLRDALPWRKLLRTCLPAALGMRAHSYARSLGAEASALMSEMSMSSTSGTSGMLSSRPQVHLSGVSGCLVPG